MDSLLFPILALVVSWIVRMKIVEAFRAGREPMLWYGCMMVFAIVAATQYGALSCLGVAGVAVYVYAKLNVVSKPVEWKGILGYHANTILPRHEERKLLK